MKKVSSLMILLLAGVMMFVSCSSPSSGGGIPSDPTDISFEGKTFKLTGSVQLMQTSKQVTGSDDYNQQYTGAFPKGRIVTLSPFIMGKYEVTQELYEAVMTGQKVKIDGEDKNLSANPSYCTSNSSDYKNMLPGEEQKYRPIENVTWFDACYFCNALSEKMRLTKAYNITVTTVTEEGNITEATVTPVTGANGYRLPTEAEWEYAARGGAAGVTNGTFAYYWSGATTENYSYSKNDDINAVAWYYYNAGSLGSGTAGYGTHQVRKKDANAAGLCDMSGNVWEWCYDWYATINTDAVTDPSGPFEVQSYRVFRGGCWDDDASVCTVSCRYSNYPIARYDFLGFRVVRNAE